MDTQKKTRILVIDDDTDNVKLISEALSRAGYLVGQAYNGEEGLHKLKAWSPHLILLDINMPGMDGLATLDKIRKTPDQDYIAVIFITANGQVEDIVRGLDAGADDYLIKPFRLPELLARVRAKLRIKELNDQLRRTTKRLEDLVDQDDLTGLFNMRSVYKRLDLEMHRAHRYLKWLSCIMMDLDNFKGVNDSNDHIFGSWVLTEVAKIIRENTRNIDIAARYGGDEFLIILPETDLIGTERMAERMRKNIETATFAQGKQKTKITCSFGISAIDFRKSRTDSKEFIRLADQMLYEAKNGGRNCIKSKLIE